MGTCRTEGCNKPTTEERHPFCPDCNRKKNQAAAGSSKVVSSGNNKVSVATPPSPVPPSVSGFPENYLPDGYFNKINGKLYIKEEVFTSWAIDVSTKLKLQKMTSTKLRGFFTKLRSVEYRYKEAGRDFERAKEKLYSFKRDAKNSENKGVTPELFTKFIDKNIDLATKDMEHFMAFVEHFQSVIAYFKDDKREESK